MGNIDRPRVTLTYAQSLDGSIAARTGVPLTLSGTEAMHYTHQLRAAHDAILVGIGTVLSDNPRLNVRLTSGPSPRPIILDSALRCPVTMQCLEAQRRPIIATTEQACESRQRELEAQGITVIVIPTCSENESQLDLHVLLRALLAHHIRSVMVEGGARVITSFLRMHLVDRLIITIAPLLVGGAHGIVDLLAAEGQDFPRLRQVTCQPMGHDWIVAGIPEWGRR